MLLFLDGQRDCLHLSKEPILQDRRGEPTPVAAADHWYVSRLRARARRYGFQTRKISRGLTAKPDPPRQLDWNLDWDARAKDWRGGKPTIRNFLDLQRDAFLPILEQADSRMTVTAAVVQRDFLEAFFGPWSYMIDGPETASDSGPLPGGEPMEVDDDGPRPLHESESAIPLHRDPPPPQPQNQSALPQEGMEEQHQPQEIFQGLPSKQAWFQMPEIIDQITSLETQVPVLDPAMQVDQPEPAMAETLENPISKGSSIRTSRYKPPRRHGTNQGSQSPTSRVPALRDRRDRSPPGQSRSPIRPPTRPTPAAGFEMATDRLVTGRLIHPPSNLTESSPIFEAESRNVSVYEGPVGQLQEPVVSHTTKQQTAANPYQDKDDSRDVVRQQFTRPFGTDPLGKPERTKGKPSKRSPVEPPNPVTSVGPLKAASTGILRAGLAEANLPQSAHDLHTVRRQASTKSAGNDPWNGPGQAKTGSSKRSPILPPRDTSPAAVPATKQTHTKLSRRSPIHPSTESRVPHVPETPEASLNLTAERPVRHIQASRTEVAVRHTIEPSIQNEYINSQPDRVGTSKRPPILPPETLHNPQKSAEDNASIRQRGEGVGAARLPSRRSRVDPPENHTPRRSERIRLLSQEPSGPGLPAPSTSRPQGKVIKNKDAGRKMIRTKPPTLETSQHADPPDNRTPRRSERIRLLSQEPPGPGLLDPSSSQPLQKATEIRDARRNITKTRKHQVAPGHPQASHELSTLTYIHTTHGRPSHQNGNDQVVGVVRGNHQPVISQSPSTERANPPASPRATGGRKRKREAGQPPIQAEIDQQDFPRRRVLARLTYEQPSSSRHPRAQPKRSPIRPPATGFRVPSVSSQQSLQATKIFRVPSASSAESLQGRGRSPIRPPGTGFRVPSMSPATKTFRVPSASSAESLRRSLVLTSGDESVVPNISALESLEMTRSSRVPSLSSQESLSGDQSQSPIRRLGTESAVPRKSSKEIIKDGQRRSPISHSVPSLSILTGGPGTENTEQAQFPQVPKYSNQEELRKFQPFSESRGQYPVAGDLSDESEL